ncbi:hypothetical protein VNO77_39407 [Canavalia gladiata]|uniref:Transmembrane protein n=1 Tax=Canavalia gladiata TaxID=3824 RepID=A0AAN9PY76_CANGL
MLLQKEEEEEEEKQSEEVVNREKEVRPMQVRFSISLAIFQVRLICCLFVVVIVGMDNLHLHILMICAPKYV